MRSAFIWPILAICAISNLLAPGAYAQTVIYVDADAQTGAGNGTSWVDAFTSVRTALTHAAGLPGEKEIRVARGTYTPAPPGDPTPSRSSTFQLLNNVAIRGGYAGLGEPDPDARDIDLNETILSGNIGESHFGDDAYHLVTGSGTDDTAILDGFTIERGNASGTSPNTRGGGVYCYGGSPLIARCVIRNNQASTMGGGAYNENGATPTFDQCTFIQNNSGYGGGMGNSGASPIVMDCHFEANTGSQYAAAGMFNTQNAEPLVIRTTFHNHGNRALRSEGASPTVIDCTFTNNRATLGGGATYTYSTQTGTQSAPVFIGCRFENNWTSSSTGGGGAIYAFRSFCTVDDCDFINNRVGIDHVNLAGGGAIQSNSMTFSVTNSRFIGNWSTSSGGAVVVSGGSMSLTNCLFSGNYASTTYQNPGAGGLRTSDCAVQVVNCTFHRNWADGSGGGALVSASIPSYRPTFANTIFWDNYDSAGSGENSQIANGVQATFTHCIVMGWSGVLGGVNNLGDDPLFVDAAGADGILGNLDDDLRLRRISPGVDSGDNAAVPSAVITDLDGLPRLVDGDEDAVVVVDRGAYEVQAPRDCNSNGIDDAEEIAAGTSPDCNLNAVPDDCDLAAGTSADLNQNATPDECEADCNANGVPDDLDISAGTSADCNENLAPDECDIAVGTSADLNTNALPDECEPDCNTNGVPDDLDIAGGTSADCNANAIPDACDVTAGTSDDINANVVPDECEPDCNANGIPDDHDIAAGTSPDCNANASPDECDIVGGSSADLNANAVPDECEPDCNSNSIPDDLDLAAGTATDCNTNAIPDSCDIIGGTSADLDGNAVPDECDADCNENGIADAHEIAAGTSADCNSNALPDECDISGGTSNDADTNGIPDECTALRLFVRAGATPGGDGHTWSTAYASLQDALDEAAADPDVREIHVAEGTYRPTSRLIAGDPRTATFALQNNLALYGGYSSESPGERTDPARDSAEYLTILSGDLAGDDLPDGGNTSENAYHVTYASGANVSAVLDGFVIRGGNATIDATPGWYGGGLYAAFASPTVRRCVFEDNHAYGAGGAVFVDGADALITHCVFRRNRTDFGVESGGGGVMSRFGAYVTIADSLFVQNESDYGGAVDAYHATATLINCTLIDNHAAQRGGAAECAYESALPPPHAAALTLVNTIAWGNTAAVAGSQIAQTIGPNSTVTVRHCAVQQGALGVHVADGILLWDAASIVTADPQLAVGATWLTAHSPCVDAGTNGAVLSNRDLAGNPRIQPVAGGIVDLGAYEYTPAGDLDGDGDIDLGDYALLAACMSGPGGPAGDLDADGSADAQDFAVWQPCMTGPDAAQAGDCIDMDFDGDSDVDLVDFQILQRWLDGSNQRIAPGCEVADLDGDGDVDLSDAADLMRAY